MVLHTTDNPEAAARSQSSAISASTEAKAAVALSPVPSTAAARLRRIQSPIREMSAGSPSMNVSIGIGSLVHVGQAGHEVRSSVVVGSAVCGRASAENHPTRTECRDETGEVGGHLREDSGECACCGTCAHRIGEMSTDVGCSIGGCFVSLCGTVEFVGIDVQRNRVGCCVGVFPLCTRPGVRARGSPCRARARPTSTPRAVVGVTARERQARVACRRSRTPDDRGPCRRARPCDRR